MRELFSLLNSRGVPLATKQLWAAVLLEVVHLSFVPEGRCAWCLTTLVTTTSGDRQLLPPHEGEASRHRNLKVLGEKKAQGSLSVGNKRGWSNLGVSRKMSLRR